jgi:xanthine dehydrogenase small subunit
LPHIIWTGAIDEGGFTAIRDDGGSAVWIGAGVTHAEAHAAQLHPALDDLWMRFAGQQIRSSGTIGGNIASGSPIGDLAPAFIALGATLHLRRGPEERALPLEDYFLAYGRQDRRPGEIIVGLTVRRPKAVDDVSVHKVSKRFDDDISAVCGAFNIHIEHGTVTSARIAFGGMAATPKRAGAVDAALLGKPWTDATIDAAVQSLTQDFQPISDARASAAYRLIVAQNLLRRVYVERAHSNVQTRLVGARAAFSESAL